MDYKMMQGDCIENIKMLEDGSIDAAIMDPPYCSGGLSTRERQADTRTKYTMKSSCKKVVKKEKRKNFPFGKVEMVGMTGFEPAAFASRTQRSTKLSHIPRF